MVTVGGPRREDDAAGEDEAGAVMLAQGVEGDDAVHAARAGAADGRSADVGVGPVRDNRIGDDDRGAESLGPRGDIEGMQALDVAGVAVARLLGLRHDVERAGGGVDDGGPRDPDLRHNIAGKHVGLGDRRHPGRRVDEAGLPEQTAIAPRIRVVGVKGKDAVVLGGHEDDVVRHSADGDIGRVERLRVHKTIHRIREELAETGRTDVGRGETRLLEVLAGAAIVVVIRQDLDLSAGSLRAERDEDERNGSSAEQRLPGEGMHTCDPPF